METLDIADRVSLATGGLAPVNWLGHRRQIDGEVVRIRAHALGRQSPNRDLIISADHGMFLDGVLVQAGLLVNGETIVRGSRDEVTFWHVELDRRAILLAENAQAESCIDTGNRRQFGNCALSYDPIGATRDHCADMVFAGARLDAIRAGLPVTVWSARRRPIPPSLGGLRDRRVRPDLPAPVAKARSCSPGRPRRAPLTRGLGSISREMHVPRSGPACPPSLPRRASRRARRCGTPNRPDTRCRPRPCGTPGMARSRPRMPERRRSVGNLDHRPPREPRSLPSAITRSLRSAMKCDDPPRGTSG